MSTVGYIASQRRRARREVVVACPHCSRQVRFCLDRATARGHRLDPDAPGGMVCPFQCPKCGAPGLGSVVIGRCPHCGYDDVTSRAGAAPYEET